MPLRRKRNAYSRGVPLQPDPLLSPLVTALSGLTVVLGGLLAFWLSERRGRRQPGPPSTELPPGVAEVVATLRSAAVVLDVADDVVRATPASYALGLVRGREVPHPALLAMVHAARDEGAIKEEELELPRGPVGRGTVSVLVRVAPLGSLHVLVTAEDRTESRRIEEVRRDFTANVSHELKTPVGAISLLAETMMEAADDPEAVRRFAERTRREAGRLTTLVQEIIELSRVQGAPESLRPTLVSIDEIVTEAVDRARVGAEGKDIVIEVERHTDAQVYGEKALLVMALQNLIDNAVRYSEAGTRVSVRLGRVDGLVEIAVADQGIGIAAADRDRVFERFYRVDPARSRATGGTGLGLSIVKHVAANHGGDVQLWSRVGQGSTFTLRLPVADASAGAAVPPDVSVEVPAPKRRQGDGRRVSGSRRPDRTLAKKRRRRRHGR